jgi:formate hydrogenlyase subunit 6/NADH:ubiquinone oxidoreductase subunit I
MLDQDSINRVRGSVINDVAKQDYAADRESSDLVPSIWRPHTILYPYERLEDMEPWLFVPGNYNGRIGVIWETCTACRLCVKICPNDCLHMTTELRVDVLDGAETGEDAGYGGELEVGGWAAVEIDGVKESHLERDTVTAHDTPEDEYRFAEVIDLSGDSATVRWNDSGIEEVVESSELLVADDQIVAGRIDMGRCMFCGLCMEACNFTSFFMTNEYDGMAGFSREDLWFDAGRTRVLVNEHQEAVDSELAKRAKKEKEKRIKAAQRAKAKQAEA